MQNPWLSVWLSEYNRHAGAVQGQIIAEATRQQRVIARQQQDFVKDIAEETTKAWMSAWFPWMPQDVKKRRR